MPRRDPGRGAVKEALAEREEPVAQTTPFSSEEQAAAGGRKQSRGVEGSRRPQRQWGGVATAKNPARREANRYRHSHGAPMKKMVLLTEAGGCRARHHACHPVTAGCPARAHGGHQQPPRRRRFTILQVRRRVAVQRHKPQNALQQAERRQQAQQYAVRARTTPSSKRPNPSFHVARHAPAGNTYGAAGREEYELSMARGAPGRACSLLSSQKVDAQEGDHLLRSPPFDASRHTFEEME